MKLFDKKPKKKIKEASWKGEFRLIGRDPFIDWVIIVVITCFASIGLVYIGIMSFLNMDSRLADIANSHKSTMTNIVDTKSLDAVIMRFSGREEQRRVILNTYVPVSDPSL